MAQLMPLPLTVTRFSKIQIGFTPFWYRLTQVVPEKRPLNGCVCVCVLLLLLLQTALPLPFKVGLCVLRNYYYYYSNCN